MTGKKKERLDNLVVKTGLASTIEDARALIMAGKIVVGDHRVDKPGTIINPDSGIRIKTGQTSYVSRGGINLKNLS